MNNLSLLTAGLANFINTQTGTLIANFENVLGTSLEVKIKASSKLLAESAESSILDYLKTLQNKLGSFEPGQGLFDYNQSSSYSTQVSPELKEVMQLFLDWKSESNLAISPTTHLLTELWKTAESNQTIPSDVELEKAVDLLKMDPYALKDDGSVLKLSDQSIKLHSLAKGYVLDKTAAFALEQEGITGVVLNIGGDIIAKGDIVEQVRITNPFSSEENANSLGIVTLENQAIASSGSYKQGFMINGQSYSHIFDPKTGMPAQEIVHSSVIHSNAVTAGALATAMNILPKKESRDLAERFNQSAYLLIDQNNQFSTSDNWSVKPESSASTISFVNVKEKVWNPNLVLQINLEIADLGGYARRPYVAVWVEDENHKPVRRIAVWYRKPRWLPDLREFTASLREANMDENSIASATRSAGNYSLIWDGKNDAGEFVPQGNYTVFIEAAREHGSYQLIKQAIKCDDKTKNVSMPGNQEISFSSLVLKLK
jgi:thiamine biosynthesis lipoprotein ApbE